MPKIHPIEAYELLPRASSDSAQSFSDSDHHSSPSSNRRATSRSLWGCLIGCASCLAHPIATEAPRRCRHSRQSYRRRLCWALTVLPCIASLILCFTAVFSPSYVDPPEHYRLLDRRCRGSEEPGRANVNNEKVFIAAALYDKNGLLVGGDWGAAVMELVQLVGPRNVHLSIYEDDPDDRAKRALERLGQQLKCESPLYSSCRCAGHDTHTESRRRQRIARVRASAATRDPHITNRSGERRTKRIAFLSAVRNRALRPLRESPIRFDKLLYINDVMFNPTDAVQLLFSTNADASGRAQYGAACAVDFINPFKFYDRYATRDLQGYEMGLPFFPWFTNAGDSASRQDVLEQKDAVRVRACWGGMTAFEARWFQNHSQAEGPGGEVAPDSRITSLQLSPLRFRYELDPFWDASECCLIHADLTYLRHGHNITTDTGIYTNPYVRVAYDSYTLSWLAWTRRVERAYPFIHNLLNHAVGLPFHNPRRLEQPGDEVVEQVWKYDKDEEMPDPGELESLPRGSYHDVKRIADPGRFCGRRALVVLKANVTDGEKKWTKIPLPLPSG